MMVKKQRFTGLVALFGLAGLASGVMAQDGDDDPLCPERSASEFIHIAVCDEVLPDDTLAAEGQRICGEKLPCGVWFWQAASDAPQDAPDNHDGLTPTQVTSAQGVWVAEQGIFVRIEPVEE